MLLAFFFFFFFWEYQSYVNNVNNMIHSVQLAELSVMFDNIQSSGCCATLSKPLSIEYILVELYATSSINIDVRIPSIGDTVHQAVHYNPLMLPYLPYLKAVSCLSHHVDPQALQAQTPRTDHLSFHHRQ